MEQSHDIRLKDNSSAAGTDDVDQCLNAFDRHLESERGCAPSTRAHYLHEVRCFLVDVFPDLKTNWAALNADHVAGDGTRTFAQGRLDILPRGLPDRSHAEKQG